MLIRMAAPQAGQDASVFISGGHKQYISLSDNDMPFGKMTPPQRGHFFGSGVDVDVCFTDQKRC